MFSVERIQQKEYIVLCTVTLRLNVSIYCLPSIPNADMPTVQQKKGTIKKKIIGPHCPDKRVSTASSLLLLLLVVGTEDCFEMLALK